MNQIYEDIKVNVLPKIAEGFAMTQEYFQELFGRYVQYLIISRIFYICLGFLFIVVPLCFVRKLLRWMGQAEYRSDRERRLVCFFIIIGLPVLIGLIIVLVNIHTLIEVIYVPEVYILQQLQFMHQ